MFLCPCNHLDTPLSIHDKLYHVLHYVIPHIASVSVSGGAMFLCSCNHLDAPLSVHGNPFIKPYTVCHLDCASMVVGGGAVLP